MEIKNKGALEGSRLTLPKGKRSKGVKTRLFVIIMVLVQFITLVSPIAVYAEEEVAGETEGEESTLVSNSVRDGNVYAPDNILAVNAYEETSKYDPYVHYITTYNTLMSRMGEKPKNTPYATVYKGEHGKATSGSGKDITDKYPKKNTDTMSVITPEGDEISDDTAAGDANSESPEGELSESASASQIEEVAENLSTQATNNIMKVLEDNLYLDLTKDSLAYHGRDAWEGNPRFGIDINGWNPTGKWNGHGYRVGNTERGQEVRYGSAYIPLSTIKNSLGKGSASTPQEYKIKMKEELKRKFSGGGKENYKKLDEKFSKTSYLGQIIADAESDYVNMNKFNQIDTSASTGLAKSDRWITGEGTSENSVASQWSSHTSPIKSWDSAPENLHYLIRHNDSSLTMAEGRKITQTQGVEYAKHRYMYNYEMLPVDRDSIGNQITEAYNSALEANKRSIEAVLQTIDVNEIKASEDTKTLAWTPIYPQIVAEEKGLRDSLKDLMEKADERASVTGNKFTLAGQTRSLQGMDIFPDESKISPVLAGKSGETGWEDYVSQLRLGGEAGKVSSGTRNTARYVWVTDEENPNYHENEFRTDSGRVVKRGNYLLGLYSAESNNYDSEFKKGTVATDATIGADNYGNIINGDTGEVIVPYWHNHVFIDVGLNDYYMPYSPMLATYGDLYLESDSMIDLIDNRLGHSSKKSAFDPNDPGRMLQTYKNGVATEAQLESFLGSGSSLLKDAKEVRKMLVKEQSIENTMSVMNHGMGSMSQEDAMRGLAAVITASTTDAVKDWNAKMLADAKTGGELYVSFDPLYVDEEFADSEAEKEKQRWTASSLIQKMGWIMDYGFADVIRLTVVSNLTRTYNTTIADSGLEFIFYTDNVTNSEEWASMSVLIATVIASVMSIYILIVGFKAYRGDVKWSNVIVKVLVLGGVLFYPMFVYGNLVDYTINKPTSFILGNQMRLSVVLDTYFAEENLTRNVNEYYENMFGNYADSDDLQLGSYNVTFYTNTDKAGFDINTTSPEDSSVSVFQANRLERYQEGRSEYPKDQLVSVQVPLTDLYKWVWDVRYKGKGMDGADESMPTFEESVGAGEVLPLFQWLSNGGSQTFSVSGYQEELASYTEYKIMPDLVKPGDSVDTSGMAENSTYGAGVRAYNDNLGNTDMSSLVEDEQGVEDSLGIKVLSGSELFYEIVYNSSQKQVDDNLGELYKLSVLASSPEETTTLFYKPTDDDIRSLVRDLSNTKAGREMWYGSTKGWSNFTQAVLASPDGTNGVFIDIDGQRKELRESPNLDAPDEDYLGLTHIVRKYTPNRGEVNPYKRSTLEEDVWDINEGLLNSYLSTYSITKQSLGADENRSKPALNHAEKMVMSTEAFFQFNDSLGWNNFPQEYDVSSIKFDKYMALMFIPFIDYGQETMTFYEEESVVPMSTAEYISMSDSIWEYGLFMIAVVALLVFGLFYMAVLYFGLLLFSMYNFVKYYVIKSDFQNKSALGSVMIIGTLSLSKMAIMLVIWFGSWYMNKTIALSPQNLPAYPPTGVHSIALIFAVVIVFMFVIRPTWKGVMDDKENMGGQFFSDKASELGKKISSGGGLPGGGKGVDGGSQANKFNNGTKNPNNSMKNNAGQLGNMDKKGLSKARKQAGKIGAGAGIAGSLIGSALGSDTAKRIRNVRGALSNPTSKIKGGDRAGRKNIDTTKVKASNTVERAELDGLGNMMNATVQTVSGLGSMAVKGAKVGQELQEFKTGMITTMALGSAGAAAVVAKNLVEQGLQARVDGSNVLFDSSGYDLSDQGVRSELFNNSVAELQDQNVLKQAKINKGKVDGATAINYNYGRGDRGIDVALDNKTGIHPESFAELSETAEFKKLFIRPRESELTYDNKGNVIGIPNGGLRLVNPNMTASEVSKGMNNLYKAESKIRQENNLEERVEMDMDAMNVKGMDEQYYKENIYSKVKETNGMYSQGSRIVYDKSNRTHRQAIESINSDISKYNEGVEEGYGSDSKNLMRYVVKDGDNQGIETQTIDGEDNKVLATMVHGTDDYKKNVKKFKVDREYTAEIGDNVEAVNNLREVALGSDKTLSKTVKEFTGAKRDMRTLLRNEMSDLTSQDNVTYNHEMMDYLDTTQIGNTEDFKTVKSNIHGIERSFKQNEIGEEQYYDLIRRENSNLMNIMDSTGKMDGFILNRMEGKNPYLDKYEEKTKSNMQESKKDYKSLKDRYNESVDKLDKKVGRKNLMEMPLGVVESTTTKHGEEYQVDGKGVLVQRTDARRKRNSFEGKDKDSVMSYLMKRPIEVKSIQERKLANK